MVRLKDDDVGTAEADVVDATAEARTFIKPRLPRVLLKASVYVEIILGITEDSATGFINAKRG